MTSCKIVKFTILIVNRLFDRVVKKVSRSFQTSSLTHTCHSYYHMIRVVNYLINV